MIPSFNHDTQIRKAQHATHLHYFPMTRICSTLFILISILALLLAGAGCLQEKHPPAVQEGPRHALMQPLLGAVAGTTQDTLDALDIAVSGSAGAIGTSGLFGPATDNILADLVSFHPAVITAITYDTNGTVRAAEPGNAKVIVGQSLLDQEHVRQAIATRKPLMSEHFTLAQGGEGVAIAHPVFSRDGEFLGVVSTTFSPRALIAPAAGVAMAYAPFIFNVAQEDGKILYHPDPALVGKPTFNETTFARFPGILDLARRYSTERSGYATFSFYRTGSDVVVDKETYWDTVSLHGTEWRVMVIAERG